MPVQLTVPSGSGARGRVDVPEYVVNGTPRRVGEPDAPRGLDATAGADGRAPREAGFPGDATCVCRALRGLWWCAPC